jgi:hypothetical protein
VTTGHQGEPFASKQEEKKKKEKKKKEKVEAAERTLSTHLVFSGTT